MNGNAYKGWGLILVIALGVISTLDAQVIYTYGHGDLGVGYTPGSAFFETHWGIDPGSVVGGETLQDGQIYAPQAVRAQTSLLRSVDNSELAAALGVSMGHEAWGMGTHSWQPNLGFQLHSDRIGSPSLWADELVQISLTGWTGPGQVALSQFISGLGTIVWFSTMGSAFTVENNQWELGVGDHVHMNWYFSELGDYELEFTWTGTYLGEGGPQLVTGSGTFGFSVVPEPAIWTLAMGLFISVILIKRRLAERYLVA